MSTNNRRVLVIAAHPDDELLGCGGTIGLHTKVGDRVTAVIACEGESLRYGINGVGQNAHIREAAETLGIQDVRQLGFSDQRLDTITLTKIITPLERVVREVRPQTIYCQYGVLGFCNELMECWAQIRGSLDDEFKGYAVGIEK